MSNRHWEYREIWLDFTIMTVPRSSLPPNTGIVNDVGSPDIPLAYVRWKSRKPLDGEFYIKAWNFIGPIVQHHVNTLGASGWELTKSLDQNLLEGTYTDNSWAPALAWILAIFYGLSLLLLFITPYSMVYRGARLPMRRLV